MARRVVQLRIDEGIAELTLDRPKHLNALNSRLRRELETALATAAAHKDVRVLVLTGTGDRAFAAGADIKELVDLDPADSEELSLAVMAFHERLRALPLPVVAAIHGWCLGGGLELALACDIRIAAETARFGFPEVKLGVMPGGGGTARLVRLVGAAAARSLCLTGETIDAERAYQLGLVSRVVPAAELASAAEALARRLAAFSAVALRQIKSALDIAEHSDLATAQRAEAKACALCFRTDMQQTAMKDFLARRRAG